MLPSPYSTKSLSASLSTPSTSPFSIDRSLNKAACLLRSSLASLLVASLFWLPAVESVEAVVRVPLSLQARSDSAVKAAKRTCFMIVSFEELKGTKFKHMNDQLKLFQTLISRLSNFRGFIYFLFYHQYLAM